MNCKVCRPALGYRALTAFLGRSGTQLLVNLLVLTASALRARDAGRARVRPHPACGRHDAVHETMYSVACLPVAKQNDATMCARPLSESACRIFVIVVVVYVPIALKRAIVKGWEQA